MEDGMKPYPTQPSYDVSYMASFGLGHSHGSGQCGGHSHGGSHGHSHSVDRGTHSEIDMTEGGLVSPLPPGFEPSPRTNDIVKATQYGLIDQVKEVIEDGFDVNQPDQENVTLLHWAAINNRIDIARYFISKGAILEKLGGDLNSTPLHWAVRQGHLPMVVLLMQYGADPSIRDGEGYSCIHLAAQFAHTAIVAYLIAKGQDPNMVDANGMTPLMWAAYRTFAIDPTRLLLTLGASHSIQDAKFGNTALHWAVVSNNTAAVKCLLKAGTDTYIENKTKQTALVLATMRKNGFILMKIKEHRGEALELSSSSFMDRLKQNKDVKMKFAWMLPFLVLFLIGFIPSLDLSVLIRILLLCLSYAALYLIGSKLLDSHSVEKLPIALGIGTKTILYLTYFLILWPYVDWVRQTLQVISSVAMLYSFYRCYKGDPGIIKCSEDDRKRTIIELAETSTLELDRFCTTCLIRKPVRSKHCSHCDRCVAKFDHHCPWIDNCVGANNHLAFMSYLFFLPICLGICINGILNYWGAVCHTTFEADGFWVFLGQVTSCSPWTFWMLINAVAHTAWVTALVLSQLFQILVLGMTTNERMNKARYMRQHKGNDHQTGKFPYNRGFIKNCADFFQCSCLGLVRPLKIDWTKQFTADLTSNGATNYVSPSTRENYQFV